MGENIVLAENSYYLDGYSCGFLSNKSTFGL